MLSRPKLTDLLVPWQQSVNLKTSLLSRVVIVGIVCFVLVMTYGLFETRRESRELNGKTADLVVRQMLAQLVIGSSYFDATALYVRWRVAFTDIPVGGQCVRFEHPLGKLLLNNCVGSPLTRGETPKWFSNIYRSLFSSSDAQTRKVADRHRVYGNVIVTSDPNVVIARSWRQMRQMLSLTAVTILALCLLVYFAIERALAPTKIVVDGLNRIAGGDFAYRLPDVRLTELQRIAEVSNDLAKKIETTLAERSELSVRLMNAQENERRHLARELHDEFAQNLTAISALAASVERSAEKEMPELCAEAKSLSQISMTMMTSLRGTLAHLRPAELDKFGMTESLRQLVAVWNASNQNKTRFELHVFGEIPPLPDNVAVHVFRIAQEGLTNAAKHAEAKIVRLCVEPVLTSNSKCVRDGSLKITIEDNGKGLRKPKYDAASSGRGHLNMQERVAAIGGSITFEDRAHGGLAVCVQVPIIGEEDGAT